MQGLVLCWFTPCLTSDLIGLGFFSLTSNGLEDLCCCLLCFTQVLAGSYVWYCQDPSSPVFKCLSHGKLGKLWSQILTEQLTTNPKHKWGETASKLNEEFETDEFCCHFWKVIKRFGIPWDLELNFPQNWEDWGDASDWFVCLMFVAGVKAARMFFFNIYLLMRSLLQNWSKLEDMGSF